VLKKKLSVQK